MKIVAAALGHCVHVAGMTHFLRLCESKGWRTVSLGPAVSPQALLAAVRLEKPDIVAVSYRLTADRLPPLLEELREGMSTLGGKSPRWIFGGTPPAAEKACESGIFAHVFNGSETPDAVENFIIGKIAESAPSDYPSDLLSRINSSYPFPIIRHHYGEPDMKRTISGVRRIASSHMLDVISIGPDQNAQEHFFHPDDMIPSQDGAGGVPLRSAEDLESIYDASRCGNYPLLRCYSGTRDLLKWAEMSIRTINIAWGAIPLCWYSIMDGRSKVPFPDAIAEKQAAMRYYAQNGIPVEVNESHQWSLRDGHDSLAVAAAFLAAYNARAQGVQHYVIQMMFNTPPSTSPLMDLAKMLAKLEIISEIEGTNFQTYREVRAGITSLPANADDAKGHMAASAVFSMALKPHILHVVGFSEASHVVNADELIESCRIARGAIRLCLLGTPDFTDDKRVQERKNHLMREARVLLDGIRVLGQGQADPWTDPQTLTAAIQKGVLDTPHFTESPFLCGRISTACVNGGWEAVDPVTLCPIDERTRLRKLGVVTG